MGSALGSLTSAPRVLSPRRVIALDQTIADRNRAVGVGGDVGLVGDEDDGVAGEWRRSNTPMISMPVFESRLPVGSSASRIDGLFTSARAMATRCR